MCDSSRGFALHHSGVIYLLVLLVCKLCLDKVGMWLKFQISENLRFFSKSENLFIFSSPADEVVQVNVL